MTFAWRCNTHHIGQFGYESMSDASTDAELHWSANEGCAISLGSDDAEAQGCNIEALMSRVAKLESDVAELQPHSKQNMRPFSNRPGD